MGDLWDFEAAHGTEAAERHAYGRMVLHLHSKDPGIVEWLIYFVARRALSCWELSCDDSRPRVLLDAIQGYLMHRSSVDWSDAVIATPSPYQDCRYSDTQSASDAVAECARYIAERNPLDAVSCISSADVAYDHVLTDHWFRAWFIEYAVPIAWQQRDMSPEEREAMRPPSR